MNHATADFETKSEAGYVWVPGGVDPKKPNGYWTHIPGASQKKKGLPIVGTAAYAEHPTTDIITLSYVIPGLPGVWRWQPGQPPPGPLLDWIAAGGAVETHNNMFERLIWENVAGPRYGFPNVPPRQWRCSMATARVNNLPGALGNLGEALRLDTQKDKEGKRLIDKFSTPRQPTKTDARTWITVADEPDEAESFYAYCDDDVLTEVEASGRMEPMTPDELDFWFIDQEINHRGLGVDVQGVHDCIAIIDQAIEHYGDECARLTGGVGAGQLEAIRGWLAAQGVSLPNMQAETVETWAERLEKLQPEGLPPSPALRVLQIRALIGSASVKKTYAMSHQLSRDGRIRNLIVHHGARTGRPTGEGPQPLNLPKSGPPLVVCGACRRPHRTGIDACPWCAVPCPPIKRKGKWKAEYTESVLEIIGSRSLALVEWFFGDAVSAVMGCIRGLFQAAGGHDLIASDYSAIEAVCAAMCAGETWREETFRAKIDIYLQSASKITGNPLAEYAAYFAAHADNHPDRQKVGKVAELACLAPETEVLTFSGWKRMGDIALTDRLWDGVEWVAHAGLVYRGIKPVLALDGVRMTPDHKINCSGSWREARQVVSCRGTLCRALESGSVAWSSWVRSEAQRMAAYQSGAIAGPPPTLSCGQTSAKGNRPLVPNAAEIKLPPTGKTIGAMPISCPIPNTAAGFSTESPPASLAANPTAPPTTALAGSGFTRLGPRARKGAASFLRFWSLCRGGIIRRLKWTASTRTATTRPETSDSRPNQKAGNGPSETCKPLSTSMSPVYDIAHAGPRNRFLIRTKSGAMLSHNCGYGGWTGAWRAFDPDEAQKSDEEIRRIILAWRDASPQIVAMWGGQRVRDGHGWRDELYGIEGAIIQAIQRPGEEFTPRPPSVGGIRPFPVAPRFVVRDDVLRMTLPSERVIKYHQPRLRPSDKRPGTLEISYMTWNSNPKYGALGWVRMATWGSRVFENYIQAVSHCILRFAIRNLRALGYPTVLHVYDEIVSEVPHGFGSLEEFESTMEWLPPWCQGWPVRASGGWRGKRYRKA